MMFSIDSHQHFWRLERGDYDWLTPEFEALHRDFGPADLAPHLDAAGIRKTVLVQAAPTVAETQYLLQLADQNDFIAGVVGWVDMDLGHESVADLIRFAEHDKFLGVRPMIQDVDDPKWMLDPTLEPVFRSLVDLNLRFDALVKPLHLPYLADLLARYPELKVVIDHGAKPDIAAYQWEPWSTAIANIASTTNAFCKLSGLVTETDPGQAIEEIWPYCEHLLENFGANRLMWGSDWPVLNLRSNYEEWHSAIADWLATLPVEDRDAIAGHTAIGFYGLRIS